MHEIPHPVPEVGMAAEQSAVERRELTPMDVLVLLGAVVHGRHAGKVTVPMPPNGSGFEVSMRQVIAKKPGQPNRFEITSKRVTAPVSEGDELPTKRAMPLPLRMQRAGLVLPRGVYA